MTNLGFKEKMKKTKSTQSSSKQILKMMKDHPFVCTAIMADNEKDLLTNVKHAKKGGANIAEFRIDFLKKINPIAIHNVISKSVLPLIVTVRNKETGGKFPSEKESDRIILLLNSIEAHPAFIDLELNTQPERVRSAIINTAKNGDVGVICSYHDFRSTPKTKEIVAKYDEICETGADIAKLVYTPYTKEDVVNILQAVESVRGGDIPSTIFGMGDVGQNTRILSPAIGSCLTYCALNPDPKSGLSQLSLKDTVGIFDLLATRKGWKALRREHKDVLASAMGEYLSTYSYPYGMSQIIEQ